MKVGVIQLNTKWDKKENLDTIKKYVEEAAAEKAEFVSLPEYCNFMGEEKDKNKNAEEIPNGETTQELMKLAKQHEMYIHVGSILEKKDEEKSYNTSLMIDPKGELVAKYQKIHLFDIEIQGVSKYMESNTIENGQKPQMVELPFGKAGLSICYDLRFPELYRGYALDGADILFIPAAFTRYTGMLHWEPLLRARAIENQCYVIAAGQFGTNVPGKACYGNSMVIDPWGTVVSRASEGVGITYANLDKKLIESARESIPSLKNRKPEYYDSLQ